jgi:peptide deformylase
MQPYNKNLKLPSRDLRSNMTDAEQCLWQRLRRKQILGLQFYRQKPILNFIVDFYCPVATVVMVNPEILEQSESTILGEEGCLSVPNERGQVARAEMIKVRYLTLQGESVEAVFHDFPARIVQHEVDHLNGVLFVEKWLFH